MTRRKKLVLAAATFAMLLAVGMTKTHWRVYGWARNEPFYEGLPASYYASWARRALATTLIPLGRRSQSTAEAWVQSNLPAFAHEQFWGSPPFGTLNPTLYIYFPAKVLDPSIIPILMHMTNDDAPIVRSWGMFCYNSVEANRRLRVQMLVRMLDDPEPYVRHAACVLLGHLGDDAIPGIPKLRSMTTDRSEVSPKILSLKNSVGDMAALAIRRIEPDAAKDLP